MKLLLPILAIFFVEACPLVAKDVQIASENLALAIPDSWAAHPAPTGGVYSAGDTAQTAATTLMASSSTGAPSPDSANHTVQEMIIGAQKNGATLVADSQSSHPVAGVPGYLVKCRMTMADGRLLYTNTYLFSANDKDYALLIEATDEATVSQLASIADSLRFLSPPTVPDPDTNSISFKLGRFAGYVIAIAVMIRIVQLLFCRKR